MDYAKRMDMIDMFKEPPEYRPPGTAEELAASVDYPNLNSQQYRMTRKPVADVLHSCLEHAVRNSNGQIIVAGNNYTERRWGSSFYAWESAEDVLNESKASFKKQCRYSIMALKFTKDPNLFILGSDKGSVELWSTRHSARGEGYSLYLVDCQSEHSESVTALDILEEEETKLVSSSSDGCIKIWNYAADLHSISTMTFAHTDEITGISASHSKEPLFVSSSLDRSALLWDLRKTRPASALYESHKLGFTAIYWTSKAEANSIVALGDQGGNVYFVDMRQPKSFLHSMKVFDRNIHKLIFNGTNFAVIGNTNRVKIFNDKLTLLHESSPSANYLRDVLWDVSKTSACWLVGWDLFFHRLEF